MCSWSARSALVVSPEGGNRPLYITSIWTCVHLGGGPEGLNFAPIFSPMISNTLNSISVAGFRLILTSDGILSHKRASRASMQDLHYFAAKKPPNIEMFIYAKVHKMTFCEYVGASWGYQNRLLGTTNRLKIFIRAPTLLLNLNIIYYWQRDQVWRHFEHKRPRNHRKAEISIFAKYSNKSTLRKWTFGFSMISAIYDRNGFILGQVVKSWL